MSDKLAAKTSPYREAADKIWELAKEYENKGIYSLADHLKDLSGRLHEKAHKEELRGAKDD
jgi:hypothetical protein